MNYNWNWGVFFQETPEGGTEYWELLASGLGWTLAIVVFAAFGWLGAAGAMIAAVLHNLSTLLVLGNAGRLLRFHEPLSKLEE